MTPGARREGVRAEATVGGEHRRTSVHRLRHVEDDVADVVVRPRSAREPTGPTGRLRRAPQGASGCRGRRRRAVGSVQADVAYPEAGSLGRCFPTAGSSRRMLRATGWSSRSSPTSTSSPARGQRVVGVVGLVGLKNRWSRTARSFRWAWRRSCSARWEGHPGSGSPSIRRVEVAIVSADVHDAAGLGDNVPHAVVVGRPGRRIYEIPGRAGVVADRQPAVGADEDVLGRVGLDRDAERVRLGPAEHT